jgi:hypothetical protein
LPQLDSSSINFVHGVLVGLWLEMKKLIEKIEMGIYPTKVDNDGDVKNCVGVDRMELDAIIEKKTAEEIRSRQV